MKELSYSDLRTIQIDILKFVNGFCQRNGIRYSLAYGSLLGAVRHKGYIPWDDDIDIAMLRDDYERFSLEFNKIESPYHFYDCRNDKDVHIGFGKVADTRTIIIEGADTKNLGVAIDVFPIDNLYDTLEESIRYYKSFNLPKMILVLKCRRIADVRSWWKKPLFGLAKLCLFWIPLHLIPLRMTRKLLKNTNNNSKYVGLVLGTSTKVTNIVKRRMWSTFSDIEFEGHKFMTISAQDDYLKNEYGDYMQLPPEKDRVPKHDFYKMYWL